MVEYHSFDFFKNVIIIRHGGIRGCIIVSVLFLFFFAADGSVFAQSSVESNGECILKLSLHKLDSSRMIDTLSVPVYLTGNLSDAYRYNVTKYLLSRHKQVSSDSSFNSRLRLQVTTSNQYQEVGKHKAIRSITGDIMATLTDTSGIIKGVEQYSFDQTDTVSSGLKNKLQSKWKPSQFVEVRGKRSWIIRRILEPGLLLGAIGVSIYLLFNVRGS